MQVSNQETIERVAQESAAGAGAGIAATLAMTAAMETAQRLGIMGDMPPWIITRRTLKKTSKRRRVPTPAQKAMATALHVGFGAVLGAVFQAVEDEVRPPGSPLVHALAYGLGVWAVSYAGWLPALGLMPPPKRDQTGRQLTMLVAHLLFGAGLFAAAEASRTIEVHVEL